MAGSPGILEKGLSSFRADLKPAQVVWKEGNVLFNEALNTFYLRLYGVEHMVKDQSDNKIGNPLPPHGLLFPINSKGSFICTIPDRIAHTTAFVIPIMEHWMEGKKQGNGLFNDKLNTFYLKLYVVEQMLKDNLDS